MTLPALPLNPDLLAVAGRVVWFEPPEIALADTARFLAYLMTYGTAEDLVVTRQYISEADFKEALEAAPPGIFDERSWAYWNLLADRYPPPEMPKRILR
jgi:hypothetical protein